MSQPQLIQGAEVHDRDEWWTPDDLFAELWNEFGPFDLDAAASEQNAKCPLFFTIVDDGLSQPWKGRVWCNPPYRNLIRWVEKAWYEVSREGGADLVVLLLPAQTSTRWFHDYALKHGELYWVRGKRRFGGARWQSVTPSVGVIFRREQGA